MNVLILTLIVDIVIADVRQMPYSRRIFDFTKYPLRTNYGLPLTQKRCYVGNVWTQCPKVRRFRNNVLNNIERKIQERHRLHQERRGNVDNDANISLEDEDTLNSRSRHELPLHRRVADKIALRREHRRKFASSKEFESATSLTTESNTSNTVVTSVTANKSYFNFVQALDEFERKFYATTFEKLTSIAPPSRQENGMSFVQSGLFLQLALMTFLNELDPEVNLEIAQCIGYNVSDDERIQTINETMNWLPSSNDNLKFRWSTRLVLQDPQNDRLSQTFKLFAAPALGLSIASFNGSETPKDIADALNEMVEQDSGGAIHDTFEDDDVANGFQVMLLTTIYFRARWRSSPTLLNGTRRFMDSDKAPQRTVRMIRINDIMRYADLTEWDAQALEILYSTPGLSLLIVVPRGNSLRSLVGLATNTSVPEILEKMWPQRVAVTLPLYTLRMTLLLPNKLEAMGVTHLLDSKNTTSGMFRISHAVQRIMFWAEAGRNAFKDDGLEWDEPPDLEVTVDRPYIFYVRWKNKTIMNGNFVL